MSRVVVGLFRDYEEAEAAVHDLHKNGFSRREVSLATRNAGKDSGSIPAGVSTSAGAGAALGGATGMVLGLAALAVPGIGPIIAAGPLAAALAGAGLGAAAGGILGALMQLGIPDADAGAFAEALNKGGTLVAVRCDEHDSERAEGILDRHGAIDLDEQSAKAFSPNWSSRDTQTPSFGDEGSPSEYGASGTSAESSRRSRVYQAKSTDTAERDFRRHFERTFHGGGTYEEYAPAYQYGESAGADPRYGSADWNTAEADIHRDWDSMHPGTWDRMKVAVRHAWDSVRGRR